jgi:hypothetical protein
MERSGQRRPQLGAITKLLSTDPQLIGGATHAFQKFACCMYSPAGRLRPRTLYSSRPSVLVDLLSGFPQPLIASSGILSQMRPLSLPSLSLTIRYSAIIITFCERYNGDNSLHSLHSARKFVVPNGGEGMTSLRNDNFRSFDFRPKIVKLNVE